VRELIAFVLFLSDRKDSYPWVFGSENHTGIDFSHYRELRQHLRIAVHVGADIYHYRWLAVEGREGRCQRRAINSRQHALHHLGGGHHRTSIAGGHHALRSSLPHQAGGYANGTVLFRP